MDTGIDKEELLEGDTIIPLEEETTAIGDGLRVFPPSVQFDDVEVGVLYVMTLIVQNTHNASQRIRFIPPQSEAFSLSYIGSEIVAPGLEVRAEIEFQGGECPDYRDKLVVMAGTCRLEIPLRAHSPAAKVVFDGFVNLGVLVAGNSTAKYIDFRNEGSKAGDVTITFEKSLPLTIKPKRWTAEPNSSTRVKIELVGRDLGVFRALAKVDVRGASSNPYTMLDINATVVEQHLGLVLPVGGGELNNVHFGTVYYGEERVVTALLVNNGPLPSSYHMVLNDDHTGEYVHCKH